MKLHQLSNEELERLARSRKNPYYLQFVREKMDKRLLNIWFQKGYSSKEMATFILIAEVHSWKDDVSPEVVADRYEAIHKEVVKHVFDV